MMDRERATVELEKKLDPKHVKPAEKFGPKGDYIESWFAISEANRIFGHFNWSARNVRLECIAQRERKIGRDQKDGWGVTYICTREIEVDGAIRQGTGAGHGYDVDLGLAHEGAIKEAESDAEKRALRTFGNPFGLALYDKSRANVGVDVPPPDYAAIRDRLKGRIERCVSQDDLAEVWKAEQEPIQLLKREDPPKFGELVKAKDDAKAKLQPHTPAPEREPAEPY